MGGPPQKIRPVKGNYIVPENVANALRAKGVSKVEDWILEFRLVPHLEFIPN